MCVFAVREGEEEEERVVRVTVHIFGYSCNGTRMYFSLTSGDVARVASCSKYHAESIQAIW